MSASPPRYPDLERALFTASRGLRTRLVNVARRFDLTPPQAMALRRLREPFAMRDLAATLRCDSSYITALADGLEARGLVERVQDASDRRVKHLVLTEAGRRLRSEMLDALWAGHPLANLTDEERTTLDGLLGRMGLVGERHVCGASTGRSDPTGTPDAASDSGADRLPDAGPMSDTGAIARNDPAQGRADAGGPTPR